MVKVGDKVRGFKFEAKKGDGSEASFEIGKVTGLNYNPIDKATGLNYHPSMDLYVGVEGVVEYVYEETFDVKFKNLRSVGLESDWDRWTYPIADYLEITRNERLIELGI